MRDGWVKLHRQTLDSPITKCLPDSHFKVAICLLMLANHKPNKWLWKGCAYTCKPGQFVTSRKALSNIIGVSEMVIRSALSNLEKLNFITKQVTSSNTLITICNWELYQAKESKSNQQHNQPITNEQPTDNQRATTNKNDEKNEKNEKKGTIFDFPEEVDHD